MSQLKYYDSVSGTWKALLAGAQGPQGPTGPQGTAGVVSITYGSSPPATGNTTGSMWIDSVEGVLYTDRKSTRLNSSHSQQSRMPSSA